MFNDILKGFKELTSSTALKTIGKSVGAVLVSKNLPGVIQYGANKLAGQNIDLSGPIPALSSAVVVSAFCHGKGWKTEGNVVLAYAGAELIIPHWNKALASAIDQPLVLPISSTVSTGVSDYLQNTQGISDGMETVSFPNADGQTVTRQLEQINQDGLIRTLKPPGMNTDGMSDFIQNTDGLSNNGSSFNRSNETLRALGMSVN
jgi:hypothetical protein